MPEPIEGHPHCVEARARVRAALAGLEALMAPGLTFADVIAEMEASDEPDIREGAKLPARYFGPRFGYAPPPAAVQ